MLCVENGNFLVVVYAASGERACESRKSTHLQTNCQILSYLPPPLLFCHNTLKLTHYHLSRPFARCEKIVYITRCLFTSLLLLSTQSLGDPMNAGSRVPIPVVLLSLLLCQITLTGCSVISFSLDSEYSDKLPKTFVVERSGTQSDSITVIAEPDHQAGSFHRTFWGDHYRDLWVTPVKVKVLDLSTFAGGLTPI